MIIEIETGVVLAGSRPEVGMLQLVLSEDYG